MIEIVIFIVLAAAIIKLAQNAIEYTFPPREPQMPDIID